jgi:hypothetical protein
MTNLSKKLIMAAVLVTLAVGPHYLTGAFTVNSGSGSGQTLYSNTSGGAGSNGSGSGNGGGVSTKDGGLQDMDGSGSGSAVGSNVKRSVSTLGSSYDGLPGLEGKPNSSKGAGADEDSDESSDENSDTDNSGKSVSTKDDDYMGLPKDENLDGEDNNADGVSTETSDDDYEGLPGYDEDDNDNDDDDDVSECDGRLYPKDINGHWAEIYIRRLYDLCIIEGYSDSSFRPNHNVTRAELVKMSLYSKGIDPNPGCYDADCGSPFTDLDMWQGKWIRPAWDRNIVKGYSKNKFAPNKPITRAEAVKVVLATYGYSPLNTSDSFFNDVNGWSVGWVEKAHQIGLVQGVGNGNFDPNRPITRAEAAKIIAKIMEYWDTPVR